MQVRERQPAQELREPGQAQHQLLLQTRVERRHQVEAKPATALLRVRVHETHDLTLARLRRTRRHVVLAEWKRVHLREVQRVVSPPLELVPASELFELQQAATLVDRPAALLYKAHPRRAFVALLAQWAAF